MGVVGEDDGEVAGADAERDGGRGFSAPGGRMHGQVIEVESAVFLGVILRGGGQELERAAADVLRALQEELHIGILEVRLVPLRVHFLRDIAAHDGLHPVLQQCRAVLQRHLRRRNVIQSDIQRRRNALIQADVLDVIVDHGY